MLHQEIVEVSTLELIKSLQEKEYLNGFYLVGGTALALYLGHRKSIDLDLFSNHDFDAVQLLENIHQDFQYDLFFTAKNTLKGSIGGVKVDFLAHRYGYLHEPVVMSDLKLLSLQDIIAMKLNVISVSGQRSKDFIDMYYLLEHYEIGEMLSFYKTKYSQQHDTFILKSLIYYKEVDLSDWPVLIKNPRLKWTEVKKRLDQKVMSYAKDSGL
jgi:hypothetical protein